MISPVSRKLRSLSHGGMVSLVKQTVPKQPSQVIVEVRKDEVCGVALCVALIHFMRPFNLFVERQALICLRWQAVRPDESVCQVRERAAHRFRDFLKRRKAHSCTADALRTEALPTSEGPVGAISVRSACSSIEWSSAVVLSCWDGSHRAIGERAPFSHLMCASV